MPSPVTRRDALRSLVAGASGTLLATQHAEAADGAVSATQPAAAAQPTGVCVLFPQAVEGPFYFDPKLVRADITDGRPGAAVDLVLRVIESGPCTPIAKARNTPRFSLRPVFFESLARFSFVPRIGANRSTVSSKVTRPNRQPSSRSMML